MDPEVANQSLDPTLTTWHITWGTKGARLHGDDRPTVDRHHNQPGDPFVGFDEWRVRGELDSLHGDIVYLTIDQQLFLQERIPDICIKGGWSLRTCSAAHDHVHVLLDIESAIHGEKVRRLLKRWLGQELSTRFGPPQGLSWWAVQGSNKAIHDEKYLNNAFRYVFEQRAAS